MCDDDAKVCGCDRKPTWFSWTKRELRASLSCQLEWKFNDVRKNVAFFSARNIVLELRRRGGLLRCQWRSVLQSSDDSDQVSWDAFSLSVCESILQCRYKKRSFRLGNIQIADNFRLAHLSIKYLSGEWKLSSNGAKSVHCGSSWTEYQVNTCEDVEWRRIFSAKQTWLLLPSHVSRLAHVIKQQKKNHKWKWINAK